MSTLGCPAAQQEPTIRLRHLVSKLGPYLSLALFLVQAGLIRASETGTGMIIAAYAAGILVVEQLFGVVKSKLLTCHGLISC